MFTTELTHFKTQQAELQRQAAHYRLVKSLESKASLGDQLALALGRALIHFGRELQATARAAS
jgi:hypothetical protein